ncbi:pilin [Patescibacteria group bacterium]|nr:pilin [Patescibacteria group bacterium]MBU1683650.1 pilin [Patescibacteria group bacterium]MBU1935314.1 pilin [Patescibacteria group bacterium]
MSSYYRILALLAMALLWFCGARADDDTLISEPIGGSALPGGGLHAEDIKSSFIFSKMLPFVIDYALKAAIALSVIVLIWAGYQFMTAFGETEKQDTARKTITYALVGLILAITAYGIVQIITSVRLS